MKTPRSILPSLVMALLVSCHLSPVTCSAATVTGTMHDLNLNVLDTTLVFQPTSAVLISGSDLSAGGPAKVISTNGAFSVALDGGNYTVALPLISWRSPFLISVPNDTGTYNITALMTAPQTFIYTNSTLQVITNIVTPIASNMVQSATNGLSGGGVTLSGVTNVVTPFTNNFGNTIAATMTNSANSFTGTFTGNGGGLTNLNGANTSNSASTNSVQQIAPLEVILDSDVGSDIDDNVDCMFLAALQRKGYVHILAMTESAPPGPSSLYLTNRGIALDRLVCDYYGIKGVAYGQATNLNNPLGAQVAANAFITDGFGSVMGWATNYPLAVTVLRQTLANSAGNVVVVCGGGFENLRDLLQSPADSISSLTGLQLVTAKVSKAVFAAGDYPTGTEFNFYIDPSAANYVVTNWPTPIIYSGFTFGNSVLTLPDYWNSQVEAGNPVKAAIYTDTGTVGRPAWTQIPMLYMLTDTNVTAQSFFGVTKGSNYVNAGSGANTFTANPAGRDLYLTNLASYATISNALNSILTDVTVRPLGFQAASLYTNTVLNVLATADATKPSVTSPGYTSGLVWGLGNSYEMDFVGMGNIVMRYSGYFGCLMQGNQNNGALYWSSGGLGSSIDSGLSQASSGVLQITKGWSRTADLGQLNMATLYLAPGGAPGSPSEGMQYVDSSSHHTFCYLSGAWKQLDNGGLTMTVTNLWSATVSNRLYFTNGILCGFTSP